MQDLRRLVRRLWSLKWMAMVPAVLGFAIAASIGVFLPDVYRGEATLIAEFSTPGGANVRRSEVERTKEVLRSVQERLYSDTFVLPMIDKLGLHPELVSRGNRDEAAERVRDDLNVNFNASSGVVTVTYDYTVGEDAPEKARDAANHISRYLVEEARSSITDESAGMRDFWEKEADDAEKRVSSLRNELMQFRLKWSGALPEDRKSNELQIEGERRAIDMVKLREDGIRQELSSLEGDLEIAERNLLEAKVIAGADDDLAPRREELLKLRQELARVELDYSPESDTVLRMKRRIKDLEAEVKRMEEQGVHNAPEDDPQVQYARISVGRIESSIQRKRKEQEGIADIVARSQQKVEALEQRISQSFQIEAEYTKLGEQLRDAEKEWDAAKKEHDRAEQIVRFHTRTEEFALHVNQSARLPRKPVGPKRLIIAAIGLILGLGLGGGLALLRVKLDTSVRSREDLRPLLPAAILISLPDISTPVRRTWSVFGKFVLATGLLLLLACTLGAVGVREGWLDTPEVAKPLIERIQDWLPKS